MITSKKSYSFILFHIFQPQTKEHMAAIELMGLKHIIVLQNKIDLIHENSAKSNYMDIRKFIQGTPAGNPFILTSLSKIPL